MVTDMSDDVFVSAASRSYAFSGVLIALHVALAVVFMVKVPNANALIKILSVVVVGIEAAVVGVRIVLSNIYLVAMPTALHDILFCFLILLAQHPWQHLHLCLKAALSDDSICIVQQLSGASESSIEIMPPSTQPGDIPEPTLAVKAPTSPPKAPDRQTKIAELSRGQMDLHVRAQYIIYGIWYDSPVSGQ